jgi:hypothetical protein
MKCGSRSAEFTQRSYCFLPLLELYPSLKCNLTRGAVTSQSNTQQPRRGRDCAFERSESSRDRTAWYASFHLAGQREVGMVEGIEHLRVQTECDALSNRERLADIDVRACVV